MKSEESIQTICRKFDEVQEKYSMVVVDGDRDREAVSNEILRIVDKALKLNLILEL